MEVKYYDQQKLLLFKITEEIDEHKVKNIRRRADYEIERFMPKRVVFDFDSVTFMDSSGIGMVIGRYKQTAMLGRKDGTYKYNRKCKENLSDEWGFKINPRSRFK